MFPSSLDLLAVEFAARFIGATGWAGLAFLVLLSALAGMIVYPVLWKMRNR